MFHKPGPTTTPKEKVTQPSVSDKSIKIIVHYHNILTSKNKTKETRMATFKTIKHALAEASKEKPIIKTKETWFSIRSTK
tara:strand:+ start:6348 stop:6587 length:240 start_codon:yes stop_codon:yes gene_type:complete